MDRGVVQSECTWSQVDNVDATRTTFHCYYPRVRKNFYESYFGVGALCNKSQMISEDGESSVEIDDVIPDTSTIGRCKSCEKIFNKLRND